jgi:CubicO group peptidase (beta-lactamase class C family)
LGKLETNRPAPDNTVFNVASLTKPVVAMVTLKLAEAGKLDLDEPLSKYWVDPDINHDSLHKLLTAQNYTQPSDWLCKLARR